MKLPFAPRGYDEPRPLPSVRVTDDVHALVASGLCTHCVAHGNPAPRARRGTSMWCRKCRTWHADRRTWKNGKHRCGVCAPDVVAPSAPKL